MRDRMVAIILWIVYLQQTIFNHLVYFEEEKLIMAKSLFISIFFKKDKQVSTTRKCHNNRLRTNTRHLEQEPQKATRQQEHN